MREAAPPLRGPIIAVVALLLIGLIGTPLTVPVARPSPASGRRMCHWHAAADADTDRPLPADGGGHDNRQLRIEERQEHVTAPMAQAFWFCVLNGYEQVWPLDDAFQQALDRGTISEDFTTQISDRCVHAIVGG